MAERNEETGRFERIDPVERFHEGYIPEPMSGCWIWEKSTNYQYGKFSPKRWKTVYAHRYSYELYNGPIPEGMYVLHKCDTPLCVNPNHLFLGTPQDNMDDMASKGRARRVHGSDLPQSKLNEELIPFIKRAYESGFSQSYIAKCLHVNQSQISRVINNKSWRQDEAV